VGSQAKKNKRLFTILLNHLYNQIFLFSLLGEGGFMPFFSENVGFSTDSRPMEDKKFDF
jgi:hypothetical protein